MASTLGTLNPLRYRGYVYDQETEVYYLQSRYYDPENGRFINADDVALLSADGSLLGYNLFTYCLNNPLRYVDYSGEIALELSATAILTIVVVGVAVVAASYFAAKAIVTTIDLLSTLWNKWSLPSFESTETAEAEIQQYSPHANNKNKANRNRHQEGDARRQRDQGGEKKKTDAQLEKEKMRGDFMIKIIDKCFRERKIASFFCDCGDTQIQLVGYVHMYNDNELLLAHISRHGNYDGFILKHIEDIRRIDYDGDYESKNVMLYQIKNQKHNSIQNDNPDAEILYSLLTFATQNKHVVSLELHNERISGFVKNFDDNTICIRVLDNYGKENGVSINHIDDVISVAVDTDDEQDLKLLAKGTITGGRGDGSPVSSETGPTNPTDPK